MTMRAAVVARLGPFEEVLDVAEDVPRPAGLAKGKVMVRVLACSISPGDFRRVRGDVDLLFRPRGRFVPGMDLCGEVVEGEGSGLRKGDVVVCSDGSFMGGLAEYAVVDAALCCVKPAKLSALEAACTPTSALRAMLAMDQLKVKKGERVLVLGAAGGFGTFIVQMLKNAGAACVVGTTSSEHAMLTSLGVDRVLNHHTEPWWEQQEFLDNPFDIVVDCGGGRENWPHASRGTALKPRTRGGRYLAVTIDEPIMQLHHWWQVCGLACPLLGRQAWTNVSSRMPAYMPFKFLDKSYRANQERLFKDFDSGKLRVVLDSHSPFPFTREGVRAAFALQASRHAHGKVVIQVA